MPADEKAAKYLTDAERAAIEAAGIEIVPRRAERDSLGMVTLGTLARILAYEAAKAGDGAGEGEPCPVPPYLADRCTCPMHATPPAHEAIPDAYQQIKDGKWVECSHFVALGFGDTLADGCRALYAAPPAPAAPAGMVWTAAEAVFRADNINHSMVPFAEQPVEVHARYKRLAMAALASAAPEGMVEAIADYLKLRDEMVTDPEERTDAERIASAQEIAALASATDAKDGAEVTG